MKSWRHVEIGYSSSSVSANDSDDLLSLTCC